MYPFMAITVHWLERETDTPPPLPVIPPQNAPPLKLRSALLAFRRIRGAHTGARVARIFLNIWDKTNLPLSKVYLFSSSNCIA